MRGESVLVNSASDGRSEGAKVQGVDQLVVEEALEALLPLHALLQRL